MSATVDPSLENDSHTNPLEISDSTSGGNSQVEGLRNGKYQRVLHGTPKIILKGATFTWRINTPPVIMNASLDVRPGELLAVVGTTGSGKSSLVSAMLGELRTSTGFAYLRGAVAYVPQQAWIFNATVRENITFGLPFDQERLVILITSSLTATLTIFFRYDVAIDASSLRADIEKQFDAGDQTEIGEKGVNMSGGQRQRISIARAVYANADIYIFDDPLSALDAHVTADVFENCMRSRLSGKTRVLVSNQLHLMKKVDRIVVMKLGQIAEVGTYEELMSNEGGEFYRLKSEGGGVEEEDDVTAVLDPGKSDSVVKLQDVGDSEGALNAVAKKPTELKKQSVDDQKETSKKDAGKLVQKEGHTVGSVKAAVYQGYFSAIGRLTFWAMVFTCVMSVAFSLGSATWLGVWSEEQAGENRGIFFYISIYVAFSVATVIFLYASNALGFSGAVTASGTMHADFVHGLMRAPISFFDSTPLGRITNRLAKDMSQVDTVIMFTLQLFLR